MVNFLPSAVTEGWSFNLRHSAFCFKKSEDDQFEAYKKVIEGMNGKQVIIRTMDIGGDAEARSKALN